MPNRGPAISGFVGRNIALVLPRPELCNLVSNHGKLLETVNFGGTP